MCSFTRQNFNESEQQYYKKMRDSVKMWQKDYDEIFELLKCAYEERNTYFGRLCKQIAKKLKLYDIYSVDRANAISFCYRKSKKREIYPNVV